MKLEINPKTGKIKVLSQDTDLGEHKSFFKGKVKGKELTVSFNHRFLIEGILEIKEKELNFQLTDEEGPAVLKPIQKEDYLYVIMPIKAS